MPLSDYVFRPRFDVRSKGLGSTDVMLIANGQWDEAFDRVKGGEPSLAHIWKARLGLFTEPLHRMWHCEKEGVTLDLPPVDGTGRSMAIIQPSTPFLCFCSIDGWIVEHDEGLEMKHTHGNNSLWACASYYMAQLQWQMMLTEKERIRFSIIKGNEEPEWGYVEADLSYQQRLMDQAALFWTEHVEKNIRPDPIEADAQLEKQAKTIKVAGTREYDYSTNNAWVDAAINYCEFQQPAKWFEEAKKALKELVPADARLVTGGGIVAKRDGRGLSIKQEGE